MKTTMIECVRSAGNILLEHFGKATNVRRKGDPSSVVTEADLASERWIIERIRSRFPRHSILSEETGYVRQDSEFTWVIDPLDGTSNFAAGLPWFGVMIAVLQNASPIMAAMFLPVTNILYLCEKGGGVWRDSRQVKVTTETDLKNVLCAVGLDVGSTADQVRWQAEILCRVAKGVRNVRATNCLVDLCYTLEGRFGGCLTFGPKIWDIAPFSLMLPEAGGKLTDLEGHDIVFRLETEPIDRDYMILGASPALHAPLLALTRSPSQT